MLESVIIGAGQAGLAMSRCLQRRGVPHVVLERDRVGASWRTRWDSFHLNTPAKHSLLPDSVRPDDGEAFWARDDWVHCMEQYVEAYALPIETGISVTSVRHWDGAFSVQTDHGAYRARSVVLCTGDQNSPVLPAVADQLPGHLHQLHTADYRRPGSLPQGAVLVVGCGQSGAQIAVDLLEAGRRVFVCTSRVARAPRRYRGRDVTDWVECLGISDHAPDDVELAEREARQGLISGRAGGRSLSLHDLGRRGAHLLGRMHSVSGGVVVIGAELLDNAAYADRRAAELCAFFDESIAKAGVDAPPAEEDAVGQPFADLPEHAAVRSLDLHEQDIRTVIWATGFSGDFAYLPAEWLDPKGLPAHRLGVCEVEGLYCLGLKWSQRRGSALVGGVGADAERLAERLVRHLER